MSNRRFHKPDGQIEFGLSGCCCPPGRRHSGMHTNAATQWFRAAGGEWIRCYGYQHAHVLAAAADTCAEFLDAMGEEPQSD